jgi:hypothetical protein
MFYTEEDIQPVVDVAVRIFGRNGSYVFDRNAKSIIVATREYGKIWSGDVDAYSIEDNCRQLARQINTDVYLFEGFYVDNLDFSQARQFSSN